MPAAAVAQAAGRPDLLVLVRHAESLRNVVKKHNRFFLDDEARQPVRGMADWQTPLTETGREQARATGARLRDRFGVFDAIYHSGYQRTEETIAGLLEAYPENERAAMPVRGHSFVRERDTGYTYDMTTAEAQAAFPWLQDYWDTHGPWLSRPPGGESLADVAQRAYMFLNMLFRDRAGRRVLVVTHGGTMRAFRFLLERWPIAEVPARLQECRIPNCGILTYRFDSAAGRLVADT